MLKCLSIKIPVLCCMTFLLFAAFSQRAYCADPMAFDLASDHVDITTGFTGTSLTVFGDRLENGDVIIILEGPERDTVVRRKDKTFGAWVNRGALSFRGIPSYYDYAISTEREEDILSPELIREKRVGLLALKAEPRKRRYKDEVVKKFQDALLRNKQAQNLYPLKPQTIQFINERLFRVDFDIPANVPSGQYKVRGLLVSNGKIVFEQSRTLKVGLEGFSSDVYKFADHHSFLYGLLCVMIAGFAGWLSNAIVRRN